MRTLLATAAGTPDSRAFRPCRATAPAFADKVRVQAGRLQQEDQSPVLVVGQRIGKATGLTIDRVRVEIRAGGAAVGAEGTEVVQKDLAAALAVRLLAGCLPVAVEGPAGGGAPVVGKDICWRRRKSANGMTVVFPLFGVLGVMAVPPSRAPQSGPECAALRVRHLPGAVLGRTFDFGDSTSRRFPVERTT